MGLYLRPTTLVDALAALGRGMTVVAGGTDHLAPGARLSAGLVAELAAPALTGVFVLEAVRRRAGSPPPAAPARARAAAASRSGSPTR